MLITTGLLLTGCESDLEVNAPWEDIAIVYGLLDKNDSIHYVRINKAYLNKDEDAREIATIPDSIYYDDSLTVTLEEYDNGVKINQWNLRKDTLYNKEAGIFAHPINILYRTPGPVTDLDPRHIYRIFLKHGEKGKSFSAQTPIVGQMTLDNPRHVLYMSEIPTLTFKWRTGINAYFYDLKLLLHIQEINSQTGDTLRRSLEWQLFRYQLTRTSERTDRQYLLDTEEFFRFVGSRLQPANNVVRRTDGVTLIFSAGGEEIYTYLRVNQPSSSIVQKEPEYTNIRNGRGIFSSRTVNHYEFKLSDQTLDSLDNGIYTRDLNFIH